MMKKFLTLALALMVALGAQVQTVVAMDASAHGVVNPFAAKAQAIRECLKRINDDGSAKADVAEFDFLAQLNSAGVLKSAVKSSEVQKILAALYADCSKVEDGQPDIDWTDDDQQAAHIAKISATLEKLAALKQALAQKPTLSYKKTGLVLAATGLITYLALDYVGVIGDRGFDDVAYRIQQARDFFAALWAPKNDSDADFGLPPYGRRTSNDTGPMKKQMDLCVLSPEPKYANTTMTPEVNVIPEALAVEPLSNAPVLSTTEELARLVEESPTVPSTALVTVPGQGVASHADVRKSLALARANEEHYVRLEQLRLAQEANGRDMEIIRTMCPAALQAGTTQCAREFTREEACSTLLPALHRQAATLENPRTVTHDSMVMVIWGKVRTMLGYKMEAEFNC